MRNKKETMLGNRKLTCYKIILFFYHVFYRKKLVVSHKLNNVYQRFEAGTKFLRAQQKPRKNSYSFVSYSNLNSLSAKPTSMCNTNKLQVSAPFKSINQLLM